MHRKRRAFVGSAQCRCCRRYQDRDLPVGDELHGGGVQAGSSVYGVPRPDFGAAPAMADAHEQKIAPPDTEVLIALGGYEVVEGYLIAGLQP